MILIRFMKQKLYCFFSHFPAFWQCIINERFWCVPLYIQKEMVAYGCVDCLANGECEWSTGITVYSLMNPSGCLALDGCSPFHAETILSQPLWSRPDGFLSIHVIFVLCAGKGIKTIRERPLAIMPFVSSPISLLLLRDKVFVRKHHCNLIFRSIALQSGVPTILRPLILLDLFDSILILGNGV